MRRSIITQAEKRRLARWRRGKCVCVCKQDACMCANVGPLVYIRIKGDRVETTDSASASVTAVKRALRQLFGRCKSVLLRNSRGNHYIRLTTVADASPVALHRLLGCNTQVVQVGCSVFLLSEVKNLARKLGIKLPKG